MAEGRSPLAPRDVNVDHWQLPGGLGTPRTGTPKLKRVQNENIAPNSAARHGSDPSATPACTPACTPGPTVADRLALVCLTTPKRAGALSAAPPPTPAHLSRAHDALAAVCIKARALRQRLCHQHHRADQLHLASLP